MREVTLHVLNVGQGLCSVVSGIKDNGEPYCGIFDCGTLAYNPECSKDMTLGQIGSLIHIGGKKVITDIVISHQDIDHWSLLMDILSGYFEMQKGCLYRKNKFFYRMAVDGTRLFTFSEFLYRHACFKGGFENERNMQKIDYELTEDEFVSNFHYEGTFYEAGKSWEIRISIFVYLLNPSEERMLTARLVCKADTGAEIAKAYYEAVIPFMKIEGYPELMNNTLQSAKEKLTYKAGEFGRMDFIYLEGHVRAVCELVQNDRHSFSEIAGLVTSVPDNAAVTPIERFVWGGAEPGPKCKLAQEIISLMRDNGFISYFKQYPDGGYVKFENDQLMQTDAMICANYDSDMIDAHEETMQQLNIKRNVTSVVACMNFADQLRFLFPGDITVHRFELLAETVKDRKKYVASIMTAPHHGSDVTNFCIFSDNDQEQPLDLVFSLFAKDDRRIFIVSAFSSKFGHPGEDFMARAVSYASSGSNHAVCHGTEVLNKGKYQRQTEETAADVFCTEMTGTFLYRYPAPQNAVCSKRTQAPRRQCKAPSKRLFI